MERDMNEARDAGARRRRASDARVDARFASSKHVSYGETPAYLLRRKSTLLREMNEDMERALREIEHRRLERELERENARAASALEREERRRREAALRARARRVRGAVWCLACAARACVRACDGLCLRD